MFRNKSCIHQNTFENQCICKISNLSDEHSANAIQPEKMWNSCLSTDHTVKIAATGGLEIPDFHFILQAYFRQQTGFYAKSAQLIHRGFLDPVAKTQLAVACYTVCHVFQTWESPINSAQFLTTTYLMCIDRGQFWQPELSSVTTKIARTLAHLRWCFVKAQWITPENTLIKILPQNKQYRGL